jgi:hypothetical protein
MGEAILELPDAAAHASESGEIPATSFSIPATSRRQAVFGPNWEGSLVKFGGARLLRFRRKQEGDPMRVAF